MRFSFPFRARQKKLSTFQLFLDTKIQKTKILSRSIMSLFISAKRPFDYDDRHKLKKWEKAVMLEKRLPQRIEQYFSPAKSSSSNRFVVGANGLKETPQNRRMWNK